MNNKLLNIIITILFVILIIFVIYAIINKNKLIYKDSVEKKKEFFTDNQISYTFYYVNWCKYCRDALPEWDTFKRAWQKRWGECISIDKVNCEQNKRICKHNFISGYPTILLKINMNVYEYDQVRNSLGFYQFLKDKCKENKIKF